ncbi:ATP-binding domain-containing protein [Hahella sp. SMD15-11]|uniref:ATP-binding domain-containing protein n=1 Tax=Thermohahella caldifontis TaxID=3142973 RepID=A0AB39UY77_9GAMM
MLGKIIFAMTIHKTQGSEFDHVLMLLPEEAERLLSRELIFTGLTRAKSGFTLLAEKAIWQAGIARQIEREGGLRQALKAIETSLCSPT